MKKPITFLVMFMLPFLVIGQDAESIKWSNGFQFESPDKAHKIKFGGRIMYDIAYFNYDSSLDDIFGEFTTGVEFRRARFFSSGQIYNNIKYKIQLDFSGGDAVFKDMYIQVNKIPLFGSVRIGHFKEPFRIEALTSSKYITFMERSLHIPFSPERNTGILFYNETNDKRVGLQVGFFRNADKQGSDKVADNGSVLTARLTGLLVNDSEKERLVHIGFGFSHRNPKSNEYKVSARPESHLAPKLVSTGTIGGVVNCNLMNYELAAVSGPLAIQGEYLFSKVNIQENITYTFSAYYGQVSYFLTGESRKYKNSYEGFNRLKPINNFGNGSGGPGAWEVALRYSNINLNDSDVNGGKMKDITFGVNWYLNPATRIMTNVVLADLQDVGNTNVFQMRFQIDF